jgi:hypothetical protein
MFASPFPPAGAPVYAPAPSRPPVARAAAPVPRRPAATAQVATAPKPIVRGAPPDDPPARSATLAMPSPEHLGVGVPRPVASNSVDWAVVGRQLQQVGARGSHLDSLPDGGFRFTCWLPGAQPGVSRRVEATAATEAEAARKALERAEQLKAGAP